MKISRYIVLFSIVCSFITNAQDLNFEHYNEINGLSHNSVRSIVQDSKGFLWLGTFGGVNRFDGYDFKVFRSEGNNQEQLQSDDILQIISDKNDNLYIATDNGLTKYNIPKSIFKTYNANQQDKYSLSGNRVRSVFIDKADRVWVGTLNNGLCYLNINENKFYKIDLGKVNNIRSICQTHNGKIWITTFNQGVFNFSIDENGAVSEIQNYKLRTNNQIGKNDSNAYFIFEDKFFNIYVGTREGLYELDKIKNQFQLLSIKNAPSEYFRSYTIAPDGSYWFGTSNGIIECEKIENLKTGNYKQHIPDLKDSSALVNNYVISLYFDYSGILWIGTENGLEKLNPYVNQFKNIKLNLNIKGQVPIVSCFAKTFDNNLLFGTHARGVFIKKGNDFIKILDKYSKVTSLFTTDNILFYIGLWNGGVVEYNYKTKKEKLLNVGFSSSPVLAFDKRSENELLIGSNGEGLVCYNLITQKTKFIKNEVAEIKDVNKIISTSNNDVWIATEEGVFKYNTASNLLKKYTEQEDGFGLSNNKIKDLIIDNNGKLWAGTRKGLNYYDPITDNFIHQKTPIDIKDVWVTDIAIDSLNIMWLNMNYNKLGKFNPKTKEFRTFYINNGVRSNLINKRGFLHYNESKIYIGGNKEIILFNPLSINENKNAPNPVISEFKVQNKDVEPREEFENQVILEQDINYLKHAELSFDNRSFSVKFSIPSYANERLNTYQYKLEGFEKQWNTTTSDSRVIQYVNLPAGEYVLKIKASNNNGYWSKESNYTISILPPFWLTYPFFILIFILLAIIFYFVRKQIRNRVKLKQELLFEKVKRERDEKLNNEKLRFFTNISHELRTPLTLILGPVKQLLEHENSEYSKSRAQLIYQNANRLLRLVNQILDFRRAETGELKLKVSKIKDLDNVKNIFYSFVELAQSKNINFNLNIEDEVTTGWIDIDKFSKILYNLLSNAIKFTPNYGNVDLFIGFKNDEEKKIIVEVSDDGIGIPIESQEKIFTRFYQARNSVENTTGTGIGLSLVKTLVEIHKGEIKVESTPDKGSVFTVELPIYKGAFTKEEIYNFRIKNEENKAVTSINKMSQNVEISKIKNISLNTNIKHSILIVEDNSELRSYVVEYLSEYYKVYQAENGKEGLELCRKVKPMLCIVDVMMPVMDGFQFVEALKTDEDISHTAVVLLTALAENENRIKGYRIGVDGYLVKPFDPTLLKTRIDNIIKIHFDLKQKFSGVAESDVLTLAHSQIDIDLISKIKEVIDVNMSSSKLTPRFLAEEMGMSSSKLYRKIKELTDLSPYEFIRTIQLKKSAELLKSRNYNVSEVSDLVGFNDPFYFSKVFKKQFGYSPSKLL